MSARIARSRTRLLLTAGTAALAAFSLTACGGSDEGVKTEGKAAASITSPAGDTGPRQVPAGAAGSEEADGQETGKRADGGERTNGGERADDAASGARKAATGGSRTSTEPVTCTPRNTRITVTEVSRPVNHLLLTATNTGTRPCFAYGAPFLRFDEGHAALPVVRDSVPQAVVTLEPGQSAYAGVGTYSPDGHEDGTARTLGVLFADRNGESTGTEVKLPLPGEGVTVNSGAQVTYWQSDLDDALAW
ncbi:DUF4232 domain-containing protein [Streptomyces sp. TRM 70361]|uniref:DUF4232 domain-containing protein n=1 Tax=Streptomyces sp. TRM 70361 TaxID=3116553 RepID=UPI002E7B0F50|nr:DUF4232 domain-containing protein [Streptomyces sp. TRM 70361]MEE1940488.1 DUF4232 domain-containing protein [Streptomyces sp. TRM 70361]